jgi:Zn-dependent peptidase ImmA (M78 family)
MLTQEKIKAINREIERFNSDTNNLPEDRIPVNIEEKIRKNNIELNKYCFDLRDDILGEIKKEDGKFKINIQARDHYYRKRFTMGHELAHFIKHKELIGDGVDDGKVGNKLYRTMYRKNDKITPKEEVEANRYSAELLIPNELANFIYENFFKDIKKEDSMDIDINFLEFLSKKFQVSAAVVSFRIKNLIKQS